jgi:hypothetical protein
LATPYFQLRLERVPSTQDVAREHLEELPLLVMAAQQTEGRGRSGAAWLTADRALAASLAWHSADGDDRPFSLMAGLAATRAIPDSTLKWPNDVLLSGRKTGGILVERSANVTVVGLGLNLWWPEAGEGMTALHDSDPGEHAYLEVGSLWGAHLIELITADGWPTIDCRVGRHLQRVLSINADDPDILIVAAIGNERQLPPVR